MDVQATTAPPLATEADTIAVGLFEDRDEFSPEVAELVSAGEARRELGKLAVLHAPERRLILVGLGQSERFGAEQARVAAAAAHGRAQELSSATLCWEVPRPRPGDRMVTGPDRTVTGLVEGTLLHAYRFERYRSEAGERRVERLLLSAAEDVEAEARRAAIVAGAQNRARDLGNLPPNDLPPSALAEYAQELADGQPAVRALVLDGEEIQGMGMGAFSAVAQGSAQDARLIRLDYEPDTPVSPRLGFVGKAVTFDAGGLALKPRQGLEEMKFDMCGGAAVIEAVAALAELEVPARVTAVVGATENLPGGRAMKAGDIVRALDGTTIEINNPDAEGRLVLADCLTYARQEGCQRLIDLATLTGGVVTALGSVYAGLMTNNGTWGAIVRECGDHAGDRLWPLPLDEQYAEMIEGRYAQLTNLAERREAQPITAAELLHHFAGDVQWAHIDIAGTAWDVPRPYYVGKGATGFGVRLLVELARTLTAGPHCVRGE
ncbi:MAG: leucyl aminopeptidase family protein [Solirubrobacteraceae bacterium]